MYCMTCSTSNSFSIIINISLFVNNYDFTFAFLKQAYYANPGADKK